MLGLAGKAIQLYLFNEGWKHLQNHLHSADVDELWRIYNRVAASHQPLPEHGDWMRRARDLLQGNPPHPIHHPIAARKFRLEKESLITAGNKMVLESSGNLSEAYELVKHREITSKQAYVTILTEDEDTEHAVILAKALDATSPGYKLVVLVSPTVTLENRSKLIGVECIVRQVGCQSDEIELWKLTEFQMVVYLRLGAFPKRNLDYLFNKSKTHATTTLAVIVLRPDQSVADTLSEFKKPFAEVFELVLRKSCSQLKPSEFSHLDEWIAQRDPVDTLPMHVISYNKEWRPWLRDSRLSPLLEGRCDFAGFVTTWLTRYEDESESESGSNEYTLLI